MNVSYKREMKHNYLMIEQEHRENSYEVKMLVNNFIDGLLKCRVKIVDDRHYFCYEITSKQPLSRLLESRSMKVEELQQMMITMARMLNHMEEYLLKEGQILLQPEFIYVEPDSFHLGYCLLPGRSGDFPGELSKLLEYLLGKVDYQDKDCVVLAYGLYRESLKENYGMEDLLRFLKSGVNDRIEKEETPLEESKPKGAYKPEAYEKKKELPAPTIWKKMRHFFIENKEVSKDVADKTPIEMPWQMVFDDEEPEMQKQELQKPEQQKQGLQKQELVEASPNTMLLAEREERIQLKRLKSLEEDVADIIIAYYPFIIGKQENVVDYILDKDTVSRLHLRLDELEGTYQITDLNSTNGTSVNGRMLENNEKTNIKTGDEIAIAGMQFRFV